jgi:hypothetical protein
MQLNRERLLDLFAQGRRRSALTDHWRVCSRLTSCLAQKSAAQSYRSQLHGYGLGSPSFSIAQTIKRLKAANRVPIGQAGVEKRPGAAT